MPKDLKSKLDALEASEKETSTLQAKAERLSELTERQKKIISEQAEVIEQQKAQLSGVEQIPDDIYELRELIGTQRVRISELEIELEHKKGEVVQVQTELELTNSRLQPTQLKLDGALETMGKLRTELAQKNSEAMVKDETIKTLAGKAGQADAFAKKLQEDLDGLRGKESEEYLKKIEELKNEHMEEVAKLKGEMGKLDGLLLDSKLASTEAGSTAKDVTTRFEEIRNKYEELINKVDELNDEKRILNKDIEGLNQIIDGLSNWKNENKDKIDYFHKLSILMEQETLFKAFLVIMEVGSITMEDLQKAIAAPIVLVKKHVQSLHDVDLVHTTDEGKIVINKLDD